MLLVKRFGLQLAQHVAKMSRRHGQGTLFIVIGAQTVEAGVYVGKQWCKDGVQQAQIDLALGATAPIAALAQIEAAITSWLQLQTPETKVKLTDVRVMLADIWLTSASLPWSDMFKRDNTVTAFARGQLEAVGFDLNPADTVKLDDAAFGAPRLAIGYSSLLLTAISGLASTFGATLTSVLPLSAAAWQVVPRAQRGKADALVVMDHGCLLSVQGNRRVSETTARPQSNIGADAATDQQILNEHIQRMRLRDLHFSQVERVAVLNLLSPATVSAAPDACHIALPSQIGTVTVSAHLHLAMLARRCRLAVDAVASKPAMTPVQWGLAAMAVLLCGAAVTQAWQMHTRVNLMQSRLEAVQARQRPAPVAVNWNRDELGRVQAVNIAIRELNLPISTLLRALQPPADILVGVLNVEVLGAAPSSTDGSAGVKIMAEAHTGADMARYVAFVTERKPFTGAYLARHEIVETSPERPYRFTVEAVWAE